MKSRVFNRLHKMNAGLEFISIQNDYKKQNKNEDKSE